MNGPAGDQKQWIKKTTETGTPQIYAFKQTLQSSLAWGRKLRLAEIRGALHWGPWGYEPRVKEFVFLG